MNDKIKIDVDSSDLTKNIKIDLRKKDRDSVNIGSEWVIKVTQTKSKYNFFKSKKSISTKVKVGISDLVVSPKLEINPNMDMLTIIRSGESHAVVTGYGECREISTDVLSETESFTLLFHPGCITDVNEEQEPKGNTPIYPIRFKLVLYSETGDVIQECEIRLGIEMEHIVNTPRIDVRISPDKRDLKYKASLGIERLGEIRIANDSRFKFEPRVNVDYTLKVVDADDKHRDLPITLDFNKSSMSSLIERGNNNYNFCVKNLASGQEVVVPILIDYSKIGNPVREPNGILEGKIKSEVVFNNSNEPDAKDSLHVNPVTFQLRKNAEQPLLNIKVTDPRNKNVIEITPEGSGDNFSERLEMSRMSFLPSQGMEFPIDIELSNPATENRNAGVYINAPQYSVKFSQGTVVKFRNPSVDNIQNLFTLQGAGEEELINGSGETRRWRLLFHSSRISDIYKGSAMERDYNVKAIIKMVFDYYIDAEGIAMIEDRSSLSQRKQMELLFVIPLFRQPNPTWLAVDFGTSAIVGKYGNLSLDLHSIKRNLDTSKDDYEINTPFLSSNLILRSVGRDKVEGRSQLMGQKDSVSEFNQLAVHLSPTSESEKSGIQHVIPCLKLIVGYDLLPNLGNYAQYQYNYTDDQTEEVVRKGMTEQVTTDDGEVFDVPTPLAKVDVIFKEVYSQLFKYYMSPIIKEQARGINQLVLTIPNTYTPLHLQRINEIVRSALSDINVRNIRFVSESDAVACYYQNNWTSINSRFGRENDKRLKSNEKVLVFDMGAGTLDVTLFKKTQGIEGKIDVTVLGKIGIAKAGNYLDSLIAQMLSKFFTEMKPFSDPDQINRSDRVKAAIELKNFIKNHIKPRLSDPDPTYEFEERRDIGIRDSKGEKRLGKRSLKTLVLDQPEFKQYIKEVTTEFLDNFFRFFRMDNVQVDTVLISGRSAKLKPLQAALAEALSKYSHENTKYIDISELTEVGSSFDKAKTIVVEGAEVYAQLFADPDASVKFHSPNLVAAYGVLYKDIHGKEEYVELLNPLETPSHKSVMVEGNEIKLYKTEEKTLDLSGTTALKLIQTFSAQTQKDWHNGNHEYITVMRELDVSGISGRAHTRLSIEVDEKNQMSFLVNGMQLSGISSSQIDINSLSNKRSLWPVLKTVNE